MDRGCIVRLPFHRDLPPPARLPPESSDTSGVLVVTNGSGRMENMCPDSLRHNRLSHLQQCRIRIARTSFIRRALLR